MRNVKLTKKGMISIIFSLAIMVIFFVLIRNYNDKIENEEKLIEEYTSYINYQNLELLAEEDGLTTTDKIEEIKDIDAKLEDFENETASSDSNSVQVYIYNVIKDEEGRDEVYGSFYQLQEDYDQSVIADYQVKIDNNTLNEIDKIDDKSKLNDKSENLNNVIDELEGENGQLVCGLEIPEDLEDEDNLTSKYGSEECQSLISKAEELINKYNDRVKTIEEEEKAKAEAEAKAKAEAEAAEAAAAAASNSASSGYSSSSNSSSNASDNSSSSSSQSSNSTSSNSYSGGGYYVTFDKCSYSSYYIAKPGNYRLSCVNDGESRAVLFNDGETWESADGGAWVKTYSTGDIVGGF